MASLFSDVLEERWGVTPETATAIALLKMSYDHDDLGLSDDFWKYPQNLDALTECFSGTPMHYKEHKIVRLGNNLFEEAASGLTKLKKLFKDAADPKAKAAYADFHNMLLEALEKEEGDEYGKAIDYKAPVPEAGEVYDASLIVLASLMRIKGDKTALKHVYETAAGRMPQYQAYWDEKLKEL